MTPRPSNGVRLALVVGLVASLSPGSAGASPWSIAIGAPRKDPEPDGDDATQREAAAAFADGEAAFDRGEYSLAASRFARAFALVPHRWTLHNLALSRARAGDAPGAWLAFDELVRTASTEDERREAQRERDALAVLVARIELRGPAGAKSCIDGRGVEIPAGGSVSKIVRPGTHRITTPRGDTMRTLAGGAEVTIDIEPVSPRDPVRPWLIAAVVGGAAATGVAATAASIADRRDAVALAASAAALSAVVTSVALGGLIVRQRHSRQREAPTLDCRVGAGDVP